CSGVGLRRQRQRRAMRTRIALHCRWVDGAHLPSILPPTPRINRLLVQDPELPARGDLALLRVFHVDIQAVTARRYLTGVERLPLVRTRTSDVPDCGLDMRRLLPEAALTQLEERERRRERRLARQAADIVADIHLVG